MVRIIGVRFRSAGKVYYFSPESMEMKVGDSVIVETARGIECGRVVFPPSDMDEAEIVQPLKSVIRVATPEDVQHAAENRKKAKEAFFICKQRIRKHELDMKLIDAEYTFDNKKVLFYFTADGRVDFRELIKDLAAVFKTRIELRQIGVRDETKLLGGYGICGRPLCCTTYLSDFAPVSIKMAKEQNLSLNPTKISGVCGRLMCCLKNEEETYEYLNRKMPNIGDTVQAPDGTTGEIVSVDILKQSVRVLVQTEDDNKEIQKYDADDLNVIARRRKGRGKKPVQETQEMDEAFEDAVKETVDQPASDESETREVVEESLEVVASEIVTIESFEIPAENAGNEPEEKKAEKKPENKSEQPGKGGKSGRPRRERRDKRERKERVDTEHKESVQTEHNTEENTQPGRGKGRRDHKNRKENGHSGNKSGQANAKRDHQERDGKKDKRDNKNHEHKHYDGKNHEAKNHDGKNHDEKNRESRKEKFKEGSGNRRHYGKDRRNKDRMPKEQGKENNAENN